MMFERAKRQGGPRAPFAGTQLAGIQLAGTHGPVVAGLFYPDDPGELRRVVDAFLEDGAAQLPELGGRVKAVIAPHAGYRYSGGVAGCAFAAFGPDCQAVERVVVIGPSHHVAFRGIALPPAAALAIPGGSLPVDPAAARVLLGRDAVVTRRGPHLREHALEVELPFVRAVFGAVSVVPLVVGEATVEEVWGALEAVWGDTATRLVISSDLSHFLPYEVAREVDRETATAIEGLGGGLRPDQACGSSAINGLLAGARAHGLSATRLDLRSSGDTAGSRDQVVGYGAWAFVEDA